MKLSFSEYLVLKILADRAHRDFIGTWLADRTDSAPSHEDVGSAGAGAVHEHWTGSGACFFACHECTHEMTRATRRIDFLEVAVRGGIRRVDGTHPAMHAGTPATTQCTDCLRDREPCPTCYAVYWQRKHGNQVLSGNQTNCQPPHEIQRYEDDGGRAS